MRKRKKGERITEERENENKREKGKETHTIKTDIEYPKEKKSKSAIKSIKRGERKRGAVEEKLKSSESESAFNNIK